MKRFLESTAVAALMTAALVGVAWADWTATLVWEKVVVEGGLSYCDEGPFRAHYAAHSLRRIEFYDWNGDATGAVIDFTGLTAFRWFWGPCSYVAASTWDSSGAQTRFAVYDRTGSVVLEWTDPDSLNPSVELSQCGSGRFIRRQTVSPLQKNIRVYEIDGSMLFSVTCDSACGYMLSGSGQRLYLPVGCVRPSSSYYPPFLPEVRVYDADNGSLLYALPRCTGFDVAREQDVVALRGDSLITVYRDGIPWGTLGNVGGVVGISPNGEYAVGMTHSPTHIEAYRLDTTALLWSIPDSIDTGEQLPAPEIANNGVGVYERKLEGSGFGITVVASDGCILYDNDFVGGAFVFLSGSGEFFVVQRYSDDLISYYSVTEE